jgi:Phage tail tube protein
MAEVLSGNITGLYYAEETSLKVLPGTPIWYEGEPNSWADFGADYSMTTRNPITHDRQRRKGAITDVEPSGGWNEDLRANSLPRFAQGFLFANAREKASTQPLNGTQRAVTGVTASDDRYAAAAGMTMFVVGHLVFATGFGVAANNGLKIVASSAAGYVGVSEALTDEASPPTAAKLQAVGFQFGSGTMSLDAAADNLKLISGTTDLTTLGLSIGEWIIVGGDATGTRFADSGDNAPFYARISAIASGSLTFDKTTGVQVDNAGTGKTIRIFFPNRIVRNEEDCTLIKTKSYTLERQLGCGAGQVEAEYIKGAIPNEMTINIPTPGADAKVNIDMSFVGMEIDYRDKTTGVYSGTRVASLNEGCFGTSLNVYQNKLAIVDPATLNPTALVAYLSEATITINNNVSGIKAIGSFGNAGVNVGSFDVGASTTGWWNGVAVPQAVRNSTDATWHTILTKENAAVIFDMPLVSLGGGRANVEANAPVTIPLELSAAKGNAGYTLMTCFFPYVPTVAMAA